MRGKLQAAGKVLIKKSLALCQTLFAYMQLTLQMSLQQIIFAPAFAFPTVNKYQRAQAFIKAHGKPYAHQAPAKVQAKEPRAKRCHAPHGNKPRRYRPFNIAGRLQTHNHYHVHGAPRFKEDFY